MYLTRLLAGAAIAALATAAGAQDDTAAVEADTAAQADEQLLDDDALDALVAPVALYPDVLLTQVLVAATYPLDLVKADRFLDENADLADKARADAVEQEDWDPSVQALAGGFPTVVQKMADDVDWTEDLGDAMLAQTDDLLDAVQRMRAQAQAAGNLGTNEAQTVTTAEDEEIAIAPTYFGVVYVPSYDSTEAYQPAAVAPAGVAVPVTTTTGVSAGDVLTTGAIAFGSAMLINEIFDDNDDDWHDYWRGPSPINWNDRDVYPPRRGGINAGGDVNIDVNRNRIHNKIKIGDGDIGHRKEHAWRPDPKQRDAVRDKLASRGHGAGAQHVRDKLAAGDHDAVKAKLAKARAEGKLKVPKPHGGDKAPHLKPHAGGKASALKPGAGGKHPDRAVKRGAESLKRDHSAIAEKARKANAGHAKAISKPKPHAKAPPRKHAPKTSALKKPPGGGGHGHHAVAKRGGAHAGKLKRH